MADRYRFEDVEIDMQSFRLLKAGEAVPIEPKALNLLIFLVEHRGRLVDRREILSAVWKDAFVTDHVLNRAIGQLRKVLQEDAKEPRFIETVPTLGYRFIADVEEIDDGRVQAALHPPSDGVSVAVGTTTLPTAGLGEPIPRSPWRKTAIVWLAVGGLVCAGAIGTANWRRVHDALSQPVGTRSLVVLPLDNLSGDASQQYLADGMTEELIGNLGRMSSLRVISRITAMQYKGAHKSMPQIARELHVVDVVTGSVMLSGDRIRIATQLFDGPADKQLWTGSYDGELHDVLEVQNQVAGAVSEAIRTQLNAGKLGQSAATQRGKPRQVDPAAYEAFLKGYYFDQNTAESEQKALGYFQQAVQLDPGFARAYVGIARSYNFLSHNGVVPHGQAMAAADAAVASALELDPNLGEAYEERGFTLMFFHWDFPGTERDFHRAIELDPSDPNAHDGLAYYSFATGKFDEALRQMKLARDLDPLSVLINTDYCNLLGMARRRTEAIAQCKVALELNPNYGYAIWKAGEFYLEQQSWGEAEELLKRGGCDALCLAAVEEVHGAKGKASSFDAWVKSKDGPDEYAKAYGYAQLGRTDQAFEWLEKAYEKQEDMNEMLFLGVDPSFDKLHTDPRFDAFLRRVGLPPRPRPDPAFAQQQTN